MPFPVDVLPSWQRDMVQAVARSTQTDEAMAAMLSLGFASAAIARKAVLERPSGGVDPLNLWVLVIAPSGENKSAVFNALVEPIEAVQTAMEASQQPGTDTTPPDGPDRQPRPALVRILEDDLFEDAPEDPARGVNLPEVVAGLRAEQDRRYPGVPLNFVTRDITPESVVQMMGDQWLGILQAAPEAGFTSLLGSSSRATGHLANLNLAWDGGNLRVRRVSRGSTTIHRASLTMVFSPQPDAFRVATANKLLRETGYLSRFLVCFPETRRGTRRAPFERIPESVLDRYRRNMWAMLALRGEDDTTPTLTLTGSATAASHAFFNEIEPQLASGGELAEVSDWVEKLRLNALRIAGVLHVAQHAAPLGNSTFDQAVSGETMQAAIEICRWLIPHGQRAFGSLVPASPGVPPGREGTSGAVLEVILNRDYLRLGEFSARDVHRASQAQFEQAEDVATGLATLVETGVLAQRREGRRTLYRLNVDLDAEPNDSDS